MKFIRFAVVVAVLGAGAYVVANGVKPLLPYARSAASRSQLGVVITDDRLDEISGCAVSARNPGVVWVHNDSGDDAVLYALRASDGVTLGVVRLAGVTARDFEDMALSGNRLYVGDIGDNSASRKSISVHSVSEPVVDVQKLKQQWTLKPVTATLRYPDGARDAEALLVDPSGAVMIIDKVDGTVWRAAKDGTLKSVASLNVPLITGASLVPGKRDVFVRTYPVILRYTVAGTGPFDAIWSAPSSVLRSPLLPQAEAVCAAAAGSTGFTISEGRRAQLIPVSW